MIGILSLAALFAAQSVTSVPGPEPKTIETKEVAFESLQAGNVDRAVSQLEARLLEDPQDPALLINLGAAYAGQQRYERAGAAYRAALDSPVRYRLELAGGSWVDSRRAARMALQALEQSGALALR